MAKDKPVEPKVQEWYDALPDEERVAFNEKLAGLRRTLADMRWSTSTNALDKRPLIGKIVVPNHDWVNGTEEDIDRATGYTDDRKTHRSKDPIIKLGEKLPEGKDLGAYIKDQLGDGKALADFYLSILSLAGKAAKINGVFMNHKLNAAQWLGERGWGKTTASDGDKGVTKIEIVDYRGANPPPPPPVQQLVEQDRSLGSAEPDVGKDEPRIDFSDLATDGQTLSGSGLIDDIRRVREIVVEEESIHENDGESALSWRQGFSSGEPKDSLPEGEEDL